MCGETETQTQTVAPIADPQITERQNAGSEELSCSSVITEETAVGAERGSTTAALLFDPAVWLLSV